MRVCDLMLLIESVVLHDRILYLPATLPADTDNLWLRSLLIDEGFLVAMPKREDDNIIGRALLASLITTEGFRSSLSPVEGWQSYISTIEGFESYSEKPLASGGRGFENLESLIDRLIERCDHDRSASNFDIPTGSSFDEAARYLISGIVHGPSGNYRASQSMLRMMYYVFASEHYGLPYLASVAAQPVQQPFPNYFKPSARAKIYEQLSSALRTTVESVAQEFEDSIVFIPPFSAIVFDRASTPSEIPSEILALRTEYNDFRSKMYDLERERLAAKSLNDRMKVLRQLQQLGTEAARPFNQPSQIKLEPALRYIPDAVDLVTNPTNPIRWARLLLSMPTDALVNWYRRRPVAKLVRTAKTVSALPGYETLLIKHFGGTLTSYTLEVQSRLLKGMPVGWWSGSPEGPRRAGRGSA